MAFYLAQINVARMKGHSIEDPLMEEFAQNLDRINTLADGHPGFVWRWKEAPKPGLIPSAYCDPKILLNISVWKSLEALRAFTYSSSHSVFIKKRKEWFHAYGKQHTALWWVGENEHPGPIEAIERLEYLQDNGPSPWAFTFAKAFLNPAKT